VLVRTNLTKITMTTIFESLRNGEAKVSQTSYGIWIRLSPGERPPGLAKGDVEATRHAGDYLHRKSTRTALPPLASREIVIMTPGLKVCWHMNFGNFAWMMPLSTSDSQRKYIMI
jgi:hypothetical protein